MVDLLADYWGLAFLGLYLVYAIRVRRELRREWPSFGWSQKLWTMTGSVVLTFGIDIFLLLDRKFWQFK